MSYILTVTLNPAVDKTIQTGKKVFLSAGGKGLNVSRTLKMLGEKTLATGFLGGTSGRCIEKELDRERIPHDFFRIKGETRTNLTRIDPATSKITRVLEHGPFILPVEVKGFKKKYASLLQKSRFVIFSGSLAPGLPVSIYRELVLLAQKKRIPVCLDTSGPALSAALWAQPFLIKPNLKEAEDVLGYRLSSALRLKKAMRDFLNLGARHVVISLGDKGAAVFDGREAIFARAPRLRAKNNVGCGDALVGGLVYNFSRCLNWQGRMRFAVACGAANTLSIKPGELKKTAVNRLAGKIKVSVL